MNCCWAGLDWRTGREAHCLDLHHCLVAPLVYPSQSRVLNREGYSSRDQYLLSLGYASGPSLEHNCLADTFRDRLVNPDRSSEAFDHCLMKVAEDHLEALYHCCHLDRQTYQGRWALTHSTLEGGRTCPSLKTLAEGHTYY